MHASTPTHPRRGRVPSAPLGATVTLGFALGLVACGGRPKYDLEPPEGFVEVHAYASEARFKARDNVGLNLRVFENARGGTLGYWSADLAEKLGERGYTLVGQAPASSANGVIGTRLDFDYTHPTTGTAKFYIAVLFATDKYRFVLQIAGDKVRKPAYASSTIEAITDELHLRGCKVRSKICKGPQPPPLPRPAPPKPTTPATAKGAPPATTTAPPSPTP